MVWLPHTNKCGIAGAEMSSEDIVFFCNRHTLFKNMPGSIITSIIQSRQDAGVMIPVTGNKLSGCFSPQWGWISVGSSYRFCMILLVTSHFTILGIPTILGKRNPWTSVKWSMLWYVVVRSDLFRQDLLPAVRGLVAGLQRRWDMTTPKIASLVVDGKELLRKAHKIALRCSSYVCSWSRLRSRQTQIACSHF